eukprot:5385382-Prymnesium_polylepis.5
MPVAEQSNARGVVLSVGFSPDGTRIVSGCGDFIILSDSGRNNIISLWGGRLLLCLCFGDVWASLGVAGQTLTCVIVCARAAHRRCFDAGAGARGRGCPQQGGVFRQLLARRVEDCILFTRPEH